MFICTHISLLPLFSESKISSADIVDPVCSHCLWNYNLVAMSCKSPVFWPCSSLLMLYLSFFHCKTNLMALCCLSLYGLPEAWLGNHVLTPFYSSASWNLTPPLLYQRSSVCWAHWTLIFYITWPLWCIASQNSLLFFLIFGFPLTSVPHLKTPRWAQFCFSFLNDDAQKG